MTKFSDSGPGGLSISDIIALAAIQRQFIESYGIYATHEIVGTIDRFCQGLTASIRSEHGADTLCAYAVRRDAEMRRALRALMAPEARMACRALGWSERPSTVAWDDHRCVLALFEEVKALGEGLGASPSDMLDLLFWTQAVLMLPKIIDGPPAESPSAPSGSGNRRARRMAMASRRRSMTGHARAWGRTSPC